MIAQTHAKAHRLSGALGSLEVWDEKSVVIFNGNKELLALLDRNDGFGFVRPE